MTKKEFSTLAASLKAAYSNNGFMATNEAVAVWYEMLSDLDYKDVHESVKHHIMTCKFPPTIAEIRKGTVKEQDFQNGMEAWALVHNAIRRGIDHADEEYSKLPEAAQRAIGSASVIHELAFADNKTVAVEKAHFLKVYDGEVAKVKERAQLPIVEHNMITQNYDMDGLRKKVVANV